MTYNPENAEERRGLPPDVVFDGAITNIQDGTVKDFVDAKYIDKWKDADSPAIHVELQVTYEGMTYDGNEIFTFQNVKGKTVYGNRSNMAKFVKKYGSMPEAGVKIKAMANKDGFPKLLMME